MIFHQIWSTLLKDGYDNHVYNYRHCSSFYSKLSHSSMKNDV